MTLDGLGRKENSPYMQPQHVQYGGANRVTARVPTKDAPVTFHCDAAGNRAEIEDAIGRRTFTYDGLNRRETATDPADNTIT